MSIDESPGRTVDQPDRFTGVVAVDGPSGTGKSTVSRGVATALGARYLDTGAMYRAVTLAVLRAGVSPDDAEAVESVLVGAELTMGTDPAAPHVALGGEQVDAEIRTAEVTAAVSAVSAVPAVRRMLIAQQREIIGAGGIVVEGRDITTVVAPDAPVRVLLTASEEARAARRGAETGTAAADQAQALRRRDTLDSRTTKFLTAAPGVDVVDTTEMARDAVVEHLLALVGQRTGFPGAAVPTPGS
ncbi:MAG: (d)CMP kinase [Mycobacterium sp.]|nr:(d)CMP kinase [Mycobacterium sp.]